MKQHKYANLPETELGATVIPIFTPAGDLQFWEVRIGNSPKTYTFKTESEALDFARVQVTGTGHLDA